MQMLLSHTLAGLVPVLSQAPRVRMWLAGTSGSNQDPRSQGYRILGKPKAPGWEAGVQRKGVTVETSPGRGICECWRWRKQSEEGMRKRC